MHEAEPEVNSGQPKERGCTKKSSFSGAGSVVGEQGAETVIVGGLAQGQFQVSKNLLSHWKVMLSDLLLEI